MNDTIFSPSPTRCSAILCLAAMLFGMASSNARTVIVLDPGHGGRDNGARWYGVSEKSLNLDVAKRVESILRKRGFLVKMTRTTDKYVSLDSRANVANQYTKSVFVSIHFNAHTNRSVKGIETFYVSSNGKNLADTIQQRLANRIHTKNRGSKKHHYAVLTKTKGVAALVECGFISNRWECKRCSASWFKAILAHEIASGIATFAIANAKR